MIRVQQEPPSPQAMTKDRDAETGAGYQMNMINIILMALTQVCAEVRRVVEHCLAGLANAYWPRFALNSFV